jgi:hypothetical protein
LPEFIAGLGADNGTTRRHKQSRFLPKTIIILFFKLIVTAGS